jgi:protein O-mannosyl-transferase
MFTTTFTGPYQPLSWLSLAIDYHFWGTKTAWGFHLTNLLLHVASAVVFYFVARRILAIVRHIQQPLQKQEASDITAADLTGPAVCWAAAAAMVLFALHPLRVESVAWATERRDVLSGLFFLLTVWAYLRYVALRPGHEGRTIWYASALVLYTAGLLSKATGVTLPIVLAIMDVYPLKRLHIRRGQNSRRGVEPILIEKVPFLVLALVAGLIALSGQARAGAMMELYDHGLIDRLVSPSVA